MKLKIGERYSVKYPDGTFESVGVIGEEGDDWYKVQNVLSGDIFFLNLNMIVGVWEFEAE